MRQQDAYRQTRAVQLKLCATSCPPPPFSKATFSSLTACLYLLNSSDREWCLGQASRHNFGLLWPWSLTSWPPRSTVHALATEEDLCQFALTSVYSISKYSVHKLVTDKQTDGRTKGHVENIMPPASLDWRTDTYSICSLSLLRSCVFTTLSAFCPR